MRISLTTSRAKGQIAGRWLPSAAILGLLLIASTLSAHQQKEAITRVLFNERSGHIEVMHRFLLHDAEHALQSIDEDGVDIISDPKVQQRFADYVRDRFALSDGAGNPIPLAPVGHEIEGRFLWIYHEAPLICVEALQIQHDALREAWPEQINLVNVEHQGTVHSATFARGVSRFVLELADNCAD